MLEDRPAYFATATTDYEAAAQLAEKVVVSGYGPPPARSRWAETQLHQLRHGQEKRALKRLATETSPLQKLRPVSERRRTVPPQRAHQSPQPGSLG